MRFEKKHWEVLYSQSHAAVDASSTAIDGAPDTIRRDIRLAGLEVRPEKMLEASDRRRLYSFAARHGLIADLFEVPGGILAAAKLGLQDGAGSRQVTVSGKGYSQAQALLGCLGEAVEIASWMYQSADGQTLVAADQAGDSRIIPGNAVLGFSKRQIGQRRRLNSMWDGWDAIPPVRQLHNAGLLAPVRDLAGARTALCPAFLCFGGFGEAVHGDSSLNADSNGCAAASTLDAAMARAVLELVERDATGIWWWRGCRRGRFAPAGNDAALAAALTEHAAETGRRAWFLDISIFHNAPVAAAISCDDDGRHVAVGFAAAFDLQAAAKSAFLEMIQTELAFDAHEMRVATRSDTPMASADSRVAVWLERANLDTMGFLAGSEPKSGTQTSQAGTLQSLIDEMHMASGGDVWFMDLQRPAFDVPVVKAICTGLAHFKPRQGCDRLWALPLQRGWQATYGSRGFERLMPLLV
ncbi:YcaO-like family protein [Mesorhizobium sp. M0217]|uniref:YcaO-like family protein n=1 Tax=unclassified Mesorhizobium TaxID=325217 RepID=UPI0033392ADC